ncbi:Ribonuclease H [Cytospora mali]|uniref:Ribonuclease H n=1 Tax=Cytospora mali TaxID=578113 RepID=A0A194UXV2_CYTMA|nr:Ribonuclease H [Valsa mali var. pyri (nom. inval.)]
MGQWAWYAVQKGRKPGVYRTWEECEAQVKGFISARFKGFNTREGAEGYVRGAIDVPGGSGLRATALGGVSSSAPARSINGSSTMAAPSSSASASASSSPRPASSVPPKRTINGLSMTAPPPPSSFLSKPSSSAPTKGMIGLSAEVLSSLLGLKKPLTHPKTVNGLFFTPNIDSPTPAKTINNLPTSTTPQPQPQEPPNPPSPEPPNPSPSPSPNPNSTPRPSPPPPPSTSTLLHTLPRTSPSSKFYTVATGRQPGVYLTWAECEAQVRGVSGARYKGFATRGEAVEFLAVYGGGGHFSQFEGAAFTPDRSAPFSDEFARLSSSQGWEPGTKRYDRERARALHNELRTHYFTSSVSAVEGEEGGGETAEPLVTVKKEEEDGEALVTTREQLTELQGFQDLCRAVRKEPADTVRGCERILKDTLVNIIDLIDARRTGAKIEVWSDFKAFRRYTLQDNKRIPVAAARPKPLLACFLQKLWDVESRPAKRARSRSRGLSSSGGIDERKKKKRKRKHGN